MEISKIKDSDKKAAIYLLKNNSPLAGDMLELALKSIEVCLARNNSNSEDNFSKFLNDMSSKIMQGMPLAAYELQVMSGIIYNIDYEEMEKERKSMGSRLGHIKRRLAKKEPLTGETLDLAMELVAVHGDDEKSKFVRNIGVKMGAGQPLDEYEYHILVDVLMLHTRLSI
jgi:hypothetical protein